VVDRPHERSKTVTMTGTRHVASLAAKTPDARRDGSTLTSLTSADLPLFDGLSIRRMIIAADMLREPHWHTNAAELGYCLDGQALVTIFADANRYEQFTLTAGQMFYIPSGALHTIENTGATSCEIIAAFTHETPQEFGMRASLAAFSDAVIGNTLHVEADTLRERSHDVVNDVFERASAAPAVTDDDERPSPNKFDVEAQSAPIQTASGTAKLARSQFWPILTDIAMYSLRISDEGMREAHWHPFTAEMGYVAKGRGRMTILDPDGRWDTYELNPGDVYFVPRAYPHHIEDLTEDGDIHFLIFFDQPMPADVGYRAGMSALRPEIVADLFKLPADRVPTLPFTAQDPLVVERINPIDPATG
jgi:oxalate decarboxylase